MLLENWIARCLNFDAEHIDLDMLLHQAVWGHDRSLFETLLPHYIRIHSGAAVQKLSSSNLYRTIAHSTAKSVLRRNVTSNIDRPELSLYLFTAVYHNWPESVEILLLGVSISYMSVSWKGFGTAPCAASKKGHSSVVSRLVNAGANRDDLRFERECFACSSTSMVMLM